MRGVACRRNQNMEGPAALALSRARAAAMSVLARRQPFGPDSRTSKRGARLGSSSSSRLERSSFQI